MADMKEIEKNIQHHKDPFRDGSPIDVADAFAIAGVLLVLGMIVHIIMRLGRGKN